MSENEMIETGVDRLFSIIKKHKKISIAEAAKLLGVSFEIAEEWGSFLEDQNSIKREYFLTKPYFILCSSDASVQNQAEDFEKKKDGIVSKADVEVASLNQDSKLIASLRRQFNSLKSELDKELKDMKVDLTQLERYDSLKNGIDQKIDYQKKQFAKDMESFNQQIESEKKKYEEFVSNINQEESRVRDVMENIVSVRDNQEIIKPKLEEFTRYVLKVKGLLDSNDSKSRQLDKDLRSIKKLLSKIKR